MNKFMKIKIFTGGLRWGKSFWEDSFNVTWPFAKLQIEDDKCIITRTIWWITKTSYVIDYNDIEFITIKKFLFQRGIIFVHKNKSIPPYLLFWTFQPKELCYLLKKNGLKIKE